MPEWSFLIFWIFLLFFWEFSCTGLVGTDFGTIYIYIYIYICTFSAYPNPVLIEIMTEWSFLIFWILLLFFRVSSFPGRVGTEFGTNIFFFFLGLSKRGLDRNNAKMKFFNFLNFFAIIWEFSSPFRVGMEFRTNIFFSISRPISSRFW